MEGSLKNNYQYQGDYSELDEDIDWHDFALRNYDAQTGRWVQADPYGQFASPYSGMGNDPVNLIDPSGGIGIPCPGTSQLAIFFMKAGEVASKGLNVLSSVSPWLSMGLNAARIAGTVYNNSVQFKAISNQLAGNMTMQVGRDGDAKNQQGGNLINTEDSNPIPPIFWEEYWHPSVKAAAVVGFNHDFVSSDGGAKYSDWLKDISDKTKYPGISIYQTSLIKYGTAVTLPGLGIFISTAYKNKELTKVTQHEYGHFLVAKYGMVEGKNVSTLTQYSVFYLLEALPSIRSATEDPRRHPCFWTEIQANFFAEQFFGKSYIHDEIYYPTYDHCLIK